MAASEQNQPICLREDALATVEALQRAGHTAYFAGGCVRDMLWNLTPKDFDVATDAPPQRVRELFPRSQGVGQAFGVVLVRERKSIIEVATFRADGSYSDGRRPDDVRFATPQEDAQRRDFTINGIFLDPVTGQVIDHVNGQADLATRTLRAIGDPARRFAEDYLRLLRAVRFASRFDLTIHDETANAIRANAHKLPRIAPERIADELRAMMLSPKRTRCVALFEALGLSSVLLRGISPFSTSPVGEAALFKAVLPGESIAFSLALVSFAVDALMRTGEPMTTILAPGRVAEIARALRQSFRLSNEELADVATILDVGTMLVGTLPRISVMKRYLARTNSALGIALMDALARVGHFVDRVETLRTTFATFEPNTIAPEPLIDGTDLQALGHTPGPMFKRVLDAAYDAQLEARIATKDEAIELAKSHFAR